MWGGLLNVFGFFILGGMSKGFVDQLLHNMKLAGIGAKASPWGVEGMRDVQMNVRYVGIKLNDEWVDVLPEGNNLLLKFVIDRNTAFLEFYLANKPPFFKISSTRFTDNDKWELLLGEFRRRLKRDKSDFISHTDKVGNLYAMINKQREKIKIFFKAETI